MHGIQFHGLEEAQRAALANVSPRYVRLQELESWSRGTQYDSRPEWWTGGSNEAPLWERKPCFVYPVVQIAIASNVDLVLGEGRYPGITSKPGEDEGGEEFGLNETDSDKLDRFIGQYHKRCNFRSHVREAFASAQATGTAVGIHGHRKGRPFADVIPSKWGTPQFDDDGNVEQLEIRYPYFEEFKEHGQWRVRAKLYRRVIDVEKDITFFPADARDDGAEPNWRPDPAQSVRHGLGFCPVIWYPFMRGCAPVNRVDGHAIHENQRDEIHNLDMALSQKQRCMIHSEPQPVEIGVSPGYNPTSELGRMARAMPDDAGHRTPEEMQSVAKNGAYIYTDDSSHHQRAARKKGPGFVWQYADPKSKVEYLAFPSGLLKEQEDHCNDLLQKIEQSMAVVLPKPSEFKFAGSVSGRSLQETKSRQYDRCDQYREDLEQNFMLPTVSMQLRIAQRARETLRVPGIRDVLPILDRFNVESA